MWPGIAIGGGCLPWLAIGLVAAQSMEVQPNSGRVLLGDPVAFRISVVLGPGQELIDRIPRPLISTPSGTDYLGGDTLQSTGAGRFEGIVRFQFFRLGNQPVPTLALLYRDSANQALDTLVPPSISLAVQGLAPAGTPDLKDIRPLADVGPPAWAPLVILLVVLVVGGLVLARAGRARTALVAATGTRVPRGGPFDAALARVAALESADVGVVDLFEGLGHALREALLAAGISDATTLTAEELRSRLGPSGEPLLAPERCLHLIGASDLVQFAHVRPDRATAIAHLSAARALIEDWSHGGGGRSHAVR